MFEELIKKRNDNQDLIACMREAVDKLLENDTSSKNPGILLGKIQSGKTRAFIGIIALSFDKNYDISIILTKGTKVLVKQTVQRLEADFRQFINEDIVDVYDIMHLPNNLTKYERNKKLIIVVKKEVNNMKKILENLAQIYPDLLDKKVLIVDDEADYASVSYYKRKEAIEVGRISSQIDEMRRIVRNVDYLQVTATPYSLYLQPSEIENDTKYLPKRPAFTTLVPIHRSYIGGEFYFEQSEDEESIAADIYVEVSETEREILKKADRRRFKLEHALTSEKIVAIRKAIMTFIVGASIRRIQQNKLSNKQVEKYAFVVHSEIRRAAHEWQAEIVTKLVNEFAEVANNRSGIDKYIRESYDNISQSANKLSSDEFLLPVFSEVSDKVVEALIEEHIMITVVNSDKEVEELLDNNGQLKLRNPMNIYIGGQILDRGITIGNLVGFYYGRNPKRKQQDTVLQHSRMYGARPIEDLVVTRFYTTRDIYEAMKRIYEFDIALRDSFQRGGNEKGVYFIRKDVTDKLVPCSPNKLLLSSVVTLRPQRRMLPIGFRTNYKTHIEKTVGVIDSTISNWFADKDIVEPIRISLDDAKDVIALIEKTLVLNDQYRFSWRTFNASMEHLSKNSKRVEQRDKLWVVIRKNRNLSRFKKDGSFSDDPDGGSGRTARTIAREIAIDIPCLTLIKQNGLEENGWLNTPFWWPILLNPKNTETSIFAEDTP